MFRMFFFVVDEREADPGLQSEDIADVPVDLLPGRHHQRIPGQDHVPDLVSETDAGEVNVGGRKERTTHGDPCHWTEGGESMKK